MESFVLLLQEWFSTITVYGGDPASVAKVLAVLGTVTTGVQAAKKLLEKVDSFVWLRSFLPKPLQSAFDGITGLAHGYGPVVLNMVITLATTGTLVFSDGTVTGADILTILTAAGASDLLYKLFRNVLFTKKEDEMKVVAAVDLRGPTADQILDRFRHIPPINGQ